MESCLGTLGDATARCLLADSFLLYSLAILFSRDHVLRAWVSHRWIRHDLADDILSHRLVIYLLLAVVYQIACVTYQMGSLRKAVIGASLCALVL